MICLTLSAAIRNLIRNKERRISGRPPPRPPARGPTSTGPSRKITNPKTLAIRTLISAAWLSIPIQEIVGTPYRYPTYISYKSAMTKRRWQKPETRLAFVQERIGLWEDHRRLPAEPHRIPISGNHPMH